MQDWIHASSYSVRFRGTVADEETMGMERPQHSLVLFFRPLQRCEAGCVLSTDVDSRPTGFDRCTAVQETARESARRDLIYPWYGKGREHHFFSPSISPNLLFSATGRRSMCMHALVPKGKQQ
jgi:hypothetical protein